MGKAKPRGTKPKASAGPARTAGGVSPPPSARQPRRHSAKKSPQPKKGGITEQQKRFCGAFVLSGDTLESAKTAGYKDASKAAKRLMDNKGVLDYIAELKRTIPPQETPTATVLAASGSGDRKAVLEAMLKSNARALDECQSAVGRAQISKEIREIMAEIADIENESDDHEGTVLFEVRQTWKSGAPHKG